MFAREATSGLHASAACAGTMQGRRKPRMTSLQTIKIARLQGLLGSVNASLAPYN